MRYIVIRTTDDARIDLVPGTRAHADRTAIVGEPKSAAELLALARAECGQAAVDAEVGAAYDALGAHREHMNATSGFVPPDDDLDGPVLSL